MRRQPRSWRPAGVASHRGERVASLRLRSWRQVVVAVLGSTALVVVPPLGVAVAFAAWAQPRLAARRRADRHRRAVLRALPDAVDLLRLAVDAGQSLPLALPGVARRVDEPLDAALQRADREAASGRPLAEALVAALAPLGERAGSLGTALADHLHYGSPLVPLLERQALELRLARRHDAEQEARRVPVRLLLPLVLCILPAFGLLTVVPLLAGSLSALPL